METGRVETGRTRGNAWKRELQTYGKRDVRETGRGKRDEADVLDLLLAIISRRYVKQQGFFMRAEPFARSNLCRRLAPVPGPRSDSQPRHRRKQDEDCGVTQGVKGLPITAEARGDPG